MPGRRALLLLACQMLLTLACVQGQVPPARLDGGVAANDASAATQRADGASAPWGVDAAPAGDPTGSGAPDPDSVPDGGPAADGVTPDAGSCEPPDLLVVLDRTESMVRKPDGTNPPNTAAGHAESKWYLAITAIEALTSQLQATIRFGLELFPRNPGNGCVTLADKLARTASANNTPCQEGEILVSPDLNTGGTIAVTLDPETTRLCGSTPIGLALKSAQVTLAPLRDPIREQYVLLITDGKDTCDGGLSLEKAQALAAAGVKVFVVGFDGVSGVGIDSGRLNHLACAGRTAAGFPGTCTVDGSGDYRALDPAGAPLYLVAQDGAGLTAALEAVAGAICCGCSLSAPT
jgi:hypothetical protein